MERCFLLIGSPVDTLWPQALARALAPWGSLRVVPAGEVPPGQYAVIVVDATGVPDVPALVGRLHREQPQARLVVVAASPTWQRAREAFQAGAEEYVRKSLNVEELQALFRGLLE